MKRLLLLVSAASLAACASTTPEPLTAPPPQTEAAAEPAPVPDKNAELAAFFDEYDKAELAMSPLSKAYRGIKDADYGKWDEFTDAAGKKHDWRQELFDTLKKKQNADGSWANTNRAFLENTPELATAYAILALSYCTPKK